MQPKGWRSCRVALDQSWLTVWGRPAGREMQAETSKQEGPLPSQGIGWRAYRTHWEPTGGGAAEYRGVHPPYSVW